MFYFLQQDAKKNNNKKEGAFKNTLPYDAIIPWLFPTYQDVVMENLLTALEIDSQSDQMSWYIFLSCHLNLPF